jgi:hypothetical protein
MSEENKVEDNQEVQTSDQEVDMEETTQTQEKQEVDPVEAAIQERLAQMKSNMDRMVKERDEALKAKAELESARKKEQIERLEAEGKIKEALEMKLAEAEARMAVLNEQNTALARDNVVNNALVGLEFRNDRSREMARREIVEQLVQNENGLWVHKSGTNIQDFIVAYSKNEDNSFLFRVKVNTGAGTATPSGQSNTTEKKSLSQLSQEEVLALAAKGQLGSFSY